MDTSEASLRKAVKTAVLTIDYESGDGEGVGLLQSDTGSSMKVVVPFTLSGESVEVEIHKRRRGTSKGRLIQVLSQSPKRVLPKCMHFSSCGGCKLQHLSYEEALRYKEKKVRDLFIGLVAEEAFYPIIASPNIWEYRNKMEFSFSQNKKGDRFLGLILHESRGKVFNLQQCPIAPSWMARALQDVRIWWESSQLCAYNFRNDTGTLRTVTFRDSASGPDRMIILTVSGNPDFVIGKQEQASFVQMIEKCMRELNYQGKISIILRIHQIAKGRPTEVFEMKLSGQEYISEDIEVSGKRHTLHISPGAFSQPNPSTASILYEKVCELASLTKKDRVLDLYCGTGSFGISIAHMVSEVIGIELSYDSSYDAAVNAEKLGVLNYSVIQGDVSAILEEKKRPFLQMLCSLILQDRGLTLKLLRL